MLILKIFALVFAAALAVIQAWKEYRNNQRITIFKIVLVIIIVGLGMSITSEIMQGGKEVVDAQTREEDKKEIIDSVKNGNKEIAKWVDEKSKFEKLLLTPETIPIAAKINRDVPIAITNNFPFPVFMVVVEIKVANGNFDLKDLVIEPLGVGIWQSKYMTYQIPQINIGSTVNLIATINGSSYSDHSEIKLSIVKYFKEPVTDFTMDKMDSLPKEIKVPDNFVPKPFDNK